MLTIIASIKIKPERIADFEALARDLWAATHASEPGVRRYEYLRREGRGEYVNIMQFVDYEAFLEHQASAHHVDLAGRMRAMIDELELTYASPMPDASGVPDPLVDPADRELPMDAEFRDRIHRYGERYPEPDAPWWHG